MCIAILKPKDKTLTKELLETCSENNRDGCGFAYVNDNKEMIIKKFMDFKSFWKEYKKVQDDKTMLIHFRIATHGNVELANCHPFKLNEHMALIHNGIISGYGSKTENISDTKDFIDKVIGNISYKMWKNPSFRTLVSGNIGYSKLVILDTDENYYIINENKGEWVDGVWFSNSTYQKKKTVVSATKQSTTPSTTKDTWGYIMRCPSCNKEYITTKWYEDVCKNCKHKLEVVGYCYQGNKTYYKGKSNNKYKDYEYDYDYYDEYYGYSGYVG